MSRLPMPKYIVTIGLEVHAQLTTQSKMFCGCPVQVGSEPNTNTCPTCLGLPGALPVLNEAAIEKTILTGMMLGCSTPPVVKWDRKNYFYPDMPKNYQITQATQPLCLDRGIPLYDLAYPKDAQKSIANPGKVVKLTANTTSETTEVTTASLILGSTSAGGMWAAACSPACSAPPCGAPWPASCASA